MVSNIVSFFAGSFCGAMCLAFFVGSNRHRQNMSQNPKLGTDDFFIE